MTTPIVPYAASAEWYAAAGNVPLSLRDLARCYIYSSQGRQCLSVPIEGGASAIKRRHPSEWMLSDHGNWRHVHIGALNAAYSRTPYFEHLSPFIFPLIENSSGRLADLTLSIDKVLRDFIRLDNQRDALEKMVVEERSMYSQLREETLAEIRINCSLLDAAFRIGPSAIFALGPAL